MIYFVDQYISDKKRCIADGMDHQQIFRSKIFIKSNHLHITFESK